MYLENLSTFVMRPKNKKIWRMELGYSRECLRFNPIFIFSTPLVGGHFGLRLPPNTSEEQTNKLVQVLVRENPSDTQNTNTP
jgi:hypothetical protein